MFSLTEENGITMSEIQVLFSTVPNGGVNKSSIEKRKFVQLFQFSIKCGLKRHYRGCVRYKSENS